MHDDIAELLKQAGLRAEAAAREWLEQKGAKIETVVNDILDQRVESLVSSLMGFGRDSWQFGEVWKVDHCNGRSGESAAGDWLRERAGEAVRQWLDEQAGDLPRLPKGAIADLRREYLTVLRRELMAAVQRRAIEDAQELLGNIVTNVGDAMQVNCSSHGNSTPTIGKHELNVALPVPLRTE